MRNCVVCDVEIEAPRRLYCSNKCKQKDKNERRNGKRCGACHKPIAKPIPVMGGFKQECDRQRCIANR